MKIICGLGNPGPDYEATRHNIGWWLMDGLHATWGLEPFRSEGPARVASGQVGDHAVALVKPTTFMNRSGLALGWLRDEPGFDVARDLLVVVDDVALDIGRVRLRARGSAGGHNGLRSVEAALGTRDYTRLRIGVGAPAPGPDLVEWVLSPMPREDEERIRGLLPALVEGIRVWLDDGVEAARSRINR